MVLLVNTVLERHVNVLYSLSVLYIVVQFGSKAALCRNTDLVIIQVVGQAANEEFVGRVRHHCGHHTFRRHTGNRNVH